MHCPNVKLKSKSCVHNYVTYREYKHFKESQFLDDLNKNIIFSDSSTFDECDAYDAWDKWKHAFIDTCNVHAPLRKMRLKNRSNPWITHKIVKLMYERDFYHMKATQTKNTELGGI